MPDIRVQDEQGTIHVFPDEATPEMIAKALNVKPPSTQPKQPNLQTGQGMEQQAVQQSRQQISAPVLQAAQEHEARQARLAYLQNRAMRSPTPFTNASMLFAPTASATALIGSKIGSSAGGALAQQVSDSPEAEVYGNLIGGVIGGTAGAFSPEVRGRVGNALRTPYGPTTGASALKPGVKAIASIGKYFGGPELADRFIPERSAGPTGPYSKLPGRLPAALRGDPFSPTPPEVAPELGSPENPGWMSKIPTRMPKPIAAPAPSPFAGATPSNVPMGNAELPPTTGAQTPFPAVGKAGPVTNAPRIVAPTAGEPGFSGSEGRAATWTNEAVQRLAQQGNREAISQAIRRGMELPSGARYIMGDPDFSRAVYNPREVTQFTPEGTPIRNKSNPIAQNPSAKGRIAPGDPYSAQLPQGNFGPQNIAYRAHTAGTPEVDLTAPAHATASPQEAAEYAGHRNEGVNQKVSRIDLSRFKPGEIEEFKGPNGDTWYKVNRQLTQADYLDEE